MRVQRRDKMKIYGDLLMLLLTEPANEKNVSNILTKCNVPFTRFKKYISELKELGLIENETSLKVTEKGMEYLHEYENVLSFMKRMGISYK